MNMENTMAGILANATVAGELAEVAEVIFLKVAMNIFLQHLADQKPDIFSLRTSGLGAHWSLLLELLDWQSAPHLKVKTTLLLICFNYFFS